jgi:hypothetical protein
MDVQPVLSQTRRDKSNSQEKGNGNPAEKPGPEPFAYIPDPSDEIASSREWRDAAGQHSVKARLKSFEASPAPTGTAVLEKDDGSIVRVAVQKLSKEDQSRLTTFALASSRITIVKAVTSFLETDLGETDARITENM